MRSKILVIGFMIAAGAVVRDNRASACVITDDNTDTTDIQIFTCQGNPNPLPDPITGAMDPRPSIFFAQNGRGMIAPPQGCMTSVIPFPAVPAADCSVVPCPDPNAIQHTGNSQWSFFIQDNDRWHLDNNEWSGNGKSDTLFYDVNQPYSKMLNAAYLAWFGLKDDEAKMLHGTRDYVNLLRANDSDFHDSFFRNVHQGDSDFNGEWSQNTFSDDEVWTSCRVFDNSKGGAENNVALRMVTQLHEAWHAWENAEVHRTGLGHKVAADLTDCQSPNVCDCTVGDESCDPFYQHDMETFHPFGTLQQASVTVATGCFLPTNLCALVINPHKFHSPNQIAWEFMCDLIVSPADWVTPDIETKAQLAQGYLSAYFIHGPGFQCGSNHPMMGAM